MFDQGSNHKHDKDKGRIPGHWIARVSPNGQEDKNPDGYFRADGGCNLCCNCGAKFRNAFNIHAIAFSIMSTTR